MKSFHLGIRVLRTRMPRKRVMPSHAVSNAPSALEKAFQAFSLRLGLV